MSPAACKAAFSWHSSWREDLLKSLRVWTSLCYCMLKRTGRILTIMGFSPINVNPLIMKWFQLVLCISVCQKRMLVCILVVSCLLHCHFLAVNLIFNSAHLGWERDVWIQWSAVASTPHSEVLPGSLGSGACDTALAGDPAQKTGTLLNFQIPNLRYTIPWHISPFPELNVTWVWCRPYMQ